ncbi:hypothetical protein QE152_g4992 [Popillia japonica]|uniref:Mutator-like transposase domain-containing protein n=1 Tax=Popillia japonica TaxID=7064 RepID=A0AAW1N0J4_POPJA
MGNKKNCKYRKSRKVHLKQIAKTRTNVQCTRKTNVRSEESDCELDLGGPSTSCKVQVFMGESCDYNDHNSITESKYSDDLSECETENITSISQKQFILEFTVKCNMCTAINVIYTENPNSNHTCVTTAAVSGIIAAGAGYSCLEEVMTALDIPCISSKTFIEHQGKVYEASMRRVRWKWKKLEKRNFVWLKKQEM